MTSQGSATTRYRRAIETKSVPLAELSAREMGHVCYDKPEMGLAVTALGRTVHEDGPSGLWTGGGVREEYPVTPASSRLLTRGSGE